MPTGNYVDLADPGNVGTFLGMLEDEYQKSFASDIGWLNANSNQDTEAYKFLGNVPKFKEWLGGRSATRPKQETYSIRNKLWEQTLEFSIDDLRRDKFGQIMARIGELAQAGAAFWEDLITDLIIADGLCYDGQNFFDTDHPVAEQTTSSTTAKNELTSSELGTLNIASATAPTPDEAAKILHGLAGYMMTFKTDQNHLMNSQARKFVVMVATADLWAPFDHAANAASAQLTSGAANPIAGLRSRGYEFNVILNPNLTSATDLVYFFRADGKVKPFILQDEYGVKTSVLGAGTEEEFKHRRHLFGTERMGNAGYGLWQHAIKATMS